MTMLGWAYGVAETWLLGLALVVLALGRSTLARGDAAPVVLSLWLGFVASSLARYGLQALSWTSPFAVVAVDHLLLAGAAAAAILRWRRTAPERASAGPSRADLVAAALAACVLGLALLAASAVAQAHPFGLWDAVSMWNLKARALAAGGERWIPLLDSTSWPDYPLLLSLNVARLWAYAGGAPAADVPRWTALLLLVALAGLLAGALHRARGPWIALVGLSVLLAAEPVHVLAASQYADLPLGGMELASLVCLWRSWRGRESTALGYAALGGAFAAAAVWTKNDGIPFFVGATAAVVAGAMLVRFRGDAPRDPLRVRRLLAWGAGTLPVLAAVVHFKAQVANEPWLLAGRSLGEVAATLTTLDRWKGILFVYGIEARDYVTPATLVLWLLAVAAIPASRRAGSRACFLLLVGVVVFQLTVYTLVYVVTPFDVLWHTLSSASRLALHLWPALVWLAFLLVGDDRGPDDAGASSRKP
ncbi:MAG: hypothetical protein FJ144_17185 [Deltaproteobacteria bacterium]|nr:hypothetical protein [Deltaproteobacteria bacterium]